MNNTTNTDIECRCECHGFADDAERENCVHCMPWLYPEEDNL